MNFSYSRIKFTMEGDKINIKTPSGKYVKDEKERMNKLQGKFDKCKPIK